MESRAGSLFEKMESLESRLEKLEKERPEVLSYQSKAKEAFHGHLPLMQTTSEFSARHTMYESVSIQDGLARAKILKPEKLKTAHQNTEC